MLHHTFRFAICGALALAAAACGTALEPAPASTPAPLAATPVAHRTFVIAEVGQDASKKIKRFQPLADHLATSLAAYGYTDAEVRIIPSIDDLASELKAGQIDMVVDSPYPAMIIADRSGAQPLLRRWKGGEAEYTGVIVARADRGFTTLADLEGNYLGAETNVSTSGYFLPVALMLANGLQPVPRQTVGAELAGSEVGYIFTGDEDNTMQWVLAGRVDAGAMDRKTYMTAPEATRARLVVLGETERVARHIVLTRPDMQPALVEALKAELVRMDSTEAGRVMLEAFEKTTKFDVFPAASSLERMRELYAIVSAASPGSESAAARLTR